MEKTCASFTVLLGSSVQVRVADVGEEEKCTQGFSGRDLGLDVGIILNWMLNYSAP